MAVSLLLLLQNPQAHNFLTLELETGVLQSPLQYYENAAPKPPAMLGACCPQTPFNCGGLRPSRPLQ